MSGMGLIAAALMAGPAQASGSAGQPATKSSVSQADQGGKVKQHRDRDYVAGYYKSSRVCEWEGRRGKFLHNWDRFDCDFVWSHFPRPWRLSVERDWRGDDWRIGHRGNDHGKGHKFDHRDNDHRGGKHGR